MYYHRPAEELIFLTEKEHCLLHCKSNKNLGGIGKDNPFYGKKHSEETLKKISENRKGKPAWNKGKHLSEEWREKISAAKQHISDETRRKMSESHKGKTPWNKGKKVSQK